MRKVYKDRREASGSTREGNVVVVKTWKRVSQFQKKRRDQPFGYATQREGF